LAVISAELIGLHLLAKDNLDVISGYPAFVRMSGGFLAGCVLWLVHSKFPARTSGGDALFAISVVVTALTFLFLPASFGIVPLLGMLHCIARPGKQTYRVLAMPLAIWLGRISFSLYLSHLLILKLVKQFWPFEVRHGLDTVVAIFLALGVAALICVIIEEPTRRLSHRIAALKEKRANGSADRVTLF
jgi:peptidoglycan/LPS O-acetylase OafA/YrhL